MDPVRGLCHRFLIKLQLGSHNLSPKVERCFKELPKQSRFSFELEKISQERIRSVPISLDCYRIAFAEICGEKSDKYGISR